MLWAMMIYWLLATLRPAWQPSRLAIDSTLIAALIEFFKLYHTTLLDDFRRTLAGALLLGRYFSLWDILAYAVAIFLVATLDNLATR
jgi:hypothetical protein